MLMIRATGAGVLSCVWLRQGDVCDNLICSARTFANECVPRFASASMAVIKPNHLNSAALHPDEMTQAGWASRYSEGALTPNRSIWNNEVILKMMGRTERLLTCLLINSILAMSNGRNAADHRRRICRFCREAHLRIRKVRKPEGGNELSSL